VADRYEDDSAHRRRHDYGFKALMVPWILIKNRKMFHDYCAAMHDAGLVDMRNVNKNS